MGFDTIRARSLLSSMANGGDDDERAPGGTAGAAAAYIASLSEELAHLARRHGLNPLGYILEMARLEADQIARDSNGLEH